MLYNDAMYFEYELDKNDEMASINIGYDRYEQIREVKTSNSCFKKLKI